MNCTGVESRGRPTAKSAYRPGWVLGTLTIGDSVTRNVSYYIIAQASKFVRPGSVRIASTFVNDLPNVAFVTPGGKRVLIVLNDSEEEKQFAISFVGRHATVSLQAGSLGTLVW